MAMISPLPKLLVCYLDDQLLGRPIAEASLLEVWSGWEEGSRPLLLFHSDRPVMELQERLPRSSLPPPNFLVGCGTELLIPYARWKAAGLPDDGAESTDALLTSVVAKALELSAPDQEKQFPYVERANLTNAGLSVEFACPGRPRRASASIAVSWVLEQLKLGSSEARVYSPFPRAGQRRAR